MFHINCILLIVSAFASSYKERPLTIGQDFSDSFQENLRGQGHRDRYSDHISDRYRKPLVSYNDRGLNPPEYSRDIYPKSNKSIVPHDQEKYKQQQILATYERLRQRRQKLQALRQGAVQMDDSFLMDDMPSSHSDNSTDYGDRKSNTSKISYRGGKNVHYYIRSVVALFKL